MAFCGICLEQNYDETVNQEDRCMACQALVLLAAGVPLSALPSYEVVEEGINLAGQWYLRVRYADGSLDFLDL